MKEHEKILKDAAFSEEEIEKAKEGFERMAQRLDGLWQKEQLTPAEEKEVELILNNAAQIQEILETNQNQK